MKATVKSLIQGGRLANSKGRAALVTVLRQFEGKEVEITVQRAKKSRTNPQNRYYWSIVTIAQNFINEAGNTMSQKEVHEMFKAEFLREEVHIGDGLFTNRIRSTTELDTFEMNEYIDRVREWIRDMFNYAVPDPDTQIQLSA